MTDIFDIGIQTAIACGDDTLINCPTREQANWSFDGRAATQAHFLAVAGTSVVANTIELFAEDDAVVGVPRAVYPSNDQCIIPLYAFHWVMWCWDYYFQTGDLDFVARVMPRICATIEEVCGRLNRDSLLEWSGVWHCVETAQGRDDDHAINGAEQAGLSGALEAAIELADAIGGYEDASEAWQEVQARLALAVDAVFWDPDKDAYVDSIHQDGTRSTVTSQTTNAMICRYGLADSARCHLLHQRFDKRDSPLLKYGSPAGLYYVLEFLDFMDDSVAILRFIRKYWGDMVHAGDGTVWQSLPKFGRTPQPCRCHTFNTYVGRHLVRYLLGIQNLAPGYAQFRVCPDAPGIDWCRGAISTVAGPIRVDWTKTETTVDVSVEHPASLERVASRAAQSMADTVIDHDG